MPSVDVDAILSATRESGVESAPPIVVAPSAKRPTKSKAAAPDTDDQVTLPGRGGPQHKYLQSLVRRLAEDRGFDVSLERTVLDGHGHVDVLLERNGMTIAIEISVTTRIEHEVGNITKCLAAGFDFAVLVSSEERTRDLARAEMSGADPNRIRIMSPGEVGTFLDEIVGSPARSDKRGVRPAPHRPSESPGNRDLLSTEAAAAHLGLAVQTLAKMRVSGESPPFHKLGRRVVYDPKDLDEWLTRRKRRSTSDPGMSANRR